MIHFIHINLNKGMPVGQYPAVCYTLTFFVPSEKKELGHELHICEWRTDCE